MAQRSFTQDQWNQVHLEITKQRENKTVGRLKEY